jgi:tetratricopeptide (TPR) repeat protein
VKDTINSALNTIYETLTRHDAEFYLNPEVELTDMLVADINSYAQRKCLVIMFDAYEKLEVLDKWVRDELVARAGERVLFVFNGRRALSGKGWERYRSIIKQVELTGFTKRDTREFLVKRGLANAHAIEEITRLGHGLPLALTMLADVATRLGIADLAEVADRHNVMDRLVERLVSGTVSAHLRLGLEGAAVLRYFNEENLSFVLGDEDTKPIYESLAQLHVTRYRKYGLALHDAVRESLLEQLRWRAPTRYKDLNARAAKFYKMASDTAATEKWKQMIFEAVYHSLNADEEDGVEYIEDILWDPRLTWSERQLLLEQARNHRFENETAKYTVAFLQAQIAVDMRDMKAGKRILDAIGDSVRDNVDLRCQVLMLYGWIYDRLTHNHRAAMACYKEAYQNAKGDAEVWDKRGARLLHSIGRAYEFQGQVKDAINYLHQSVQLGQTTRDIWSVANGLHIIGNIHLLHRQKLNEALDHYNRSLDALRVLNDKRGIAVVYSRIGRVHLVKEELRDAYAYIQKSLSILQDLDPDDSPRLGWTIRDLAWYHLLAGSFEESRTCEDKARRLFEGIDMGQLYLIEMLIDLSRAYYQNGCLDATQQRAVEAERLAAEHGRSCDLARVQTVQAEVLLDLAASQAEQSHDATPMWNAASQKAKDGMLNALHWNCYLLDETIDEIARKLKESASRKDCEKASKHIVQELIEWWQTATEDGASLVQVEISLCSREGQIERTPVLDILSQFME